MYSILPLITNYKLTNKVFCSILASVLYIHSFLEMVLHLRGYACVGSTIKVRNGGVCYISFILDFIYNRTVTLI